MAVDREAPRRVVYQVTGLDCAEEVSALRRALEDASGVGALGFDVLHGRMTVDYDDALIDDAALRAAVARTGMRATPWTEEGGDDGHHAAAARAAARRTRTTALGGLALVAAFVVHALDAGLAAALRGGPPPASVALYALATVAGLVFVAPSRCAGGRPPRRRRAPAVPGRPLRPRSTPRPRRPPGPVAPGAPASALRRVLASPGRRERQSHMPRKRAPTSMRAGPSATAGSPSTAGPATRFSKRSSSPSGRKRERGA